MYFTRAPLVAAVTKKSTEVFSKAKTQECYFFFKNSKLFLFFSELYFHDFTEPNDIKVKYIFQKHGYEKNSSYAPLSLQEPFFFLVQRSKLSMQCNFSDHIVAFGSDSE